MTSHRFTTLAEAVESTMAVKQEVVMHKCEESRGFQRKGKAVGDCDKVLGTQGGSWKRQRIDRHVPVGVAAEPIRVTPIRQVAPLSCYN